MSPTIKLSSRATSEFWEIPVVYEDEHLLALDKPGGLPISADRIDPERPNLMKLLHAGIQEGKAWAKERNLSYLMNAHRADAEMSGVILLAKSKPVLVQLANAFGSEKPARKYGALVQGTPLADQFESDAKLAPHPANPAIVGIDPKRGKKAMTQFTVRERFERWAWLECRPLTSRTHQIRVHLRALHLPIVGDALYGGKPLWLSRLKSNYRLKPNREERPLIARLALHAEELIITHPVTGQIVSMQAPLPKDISVGLKYLRRYGSSGPKPETSVDSDW